MDVLLQYGVDWVVAIQALGGWLEAPMRFFTFLGVEYFFLLVLPLVYWSIDARLGLKIALILLTSNCLNFVVKLLFADPRPYWVSAQVHPYSAEPSFGIPSGHAQNSVALWGIMAAAVRRPWAWTAALLLSFLIGISRIYLGVHFIHDVVVGWLLGGALLWLVISAWDPVAAWLKGQALGRQILIAFLVSVLFVTAGLAGVEGREPYSLPEDWAANALRAGELPDPLALDGIFTSAGSLFGLAAGAAWIAAQGGFNAAGSVDKRALRYVVGLIGVIVLWYGLGQVFPRDETLLAYSLRFLRYTLVGFWATGGAPWLFFHFKLAARPNS